MANRIVDIPEANSLVAADIRNRFVLYVIDPLGTPTKADLKTTVEQLRAYLAASSDPGAVRAIEANDDGTFKYTKGDGSEVTVGLFPLNPTDGQVISWDMTSSSLVWKDIESLEFSIPDGSITAEKLADGVIPTGGGSGAEHSGAYIVDKLDGLSGDNKLSLAALNFGNIEESSIVDASSKLLTISSVANSSGASGASGSGGARGSTHAGRSYVFTAGHGLGGITSISTVINANGFINSSIVSQVSFVNLNNFVKTDPFDGNPSNSNILGIFTRPAYTDRRPVLASFFMYFNRSDAAFNEAVSTATLKLTDLFTNSVVANINFGTAGLNMQILGSSLSVTIANASNVDGFVPPTLEPGREYFVQLTAADGTELAGVETDHETDSGTDGGTDGGTSFIPVSVHPGFDDLDGYMSADALPDTTWQATPGENPLVNFGYFYSYVGNIYFAVLDSVPHADRVIITDNSDGSEVNQDVRVVTEVNSNISDNVYVQYSIPPSAVNLGFAFNTDGRSYSVQLIDFDGNRIEGSGTDSGTDNGTDGGTDNGTDNGTDSGTDNGTDSGTDSGTAGSSLALKLTPVSDIIDSINVSNFFENRFVPADSLFSQTFNASNPSWESIKYSPKILSSKLKFVKEWEVQITACLITASSAAEANFRIDFKFTTENSTNPLHPDKTVSRNLTIGSADPCPGLDLTEEELTEYTTLQIEVVWLSGAETQFVKSTDSAATAFQLRLHPADSSNEETFFTLSRSKNLDSLYKKGIYFRVYDSLPSGVPADLTRGPLLLIVSSYEGDGEDPGALLQVLISFNNRHAVYRRVAESSINTGPAPQNLTGTDWELVSEDSAGLEDDAVTTSKIKDGAITAAKLAAGVITSGGGSDTGLQEHIAEAQQQFDTLQLSLQDLTVTIQSESQQRIQVDQTLRSSIEDLEADGSVTSTRIDTHAVTTDKIEGGAVTAEKIGNHAVTTDKIEPGAVTATKIEDGAVTAAKIAAGVLTESASAAVAVHRVEVQGEIQQLVSQIESESGVRSASDVTLTAADVTLQSSITDLEADGSVTNSRIKDGAITADKLAEGVGEHSGAYIVGKLDALAGDSRLEISAVKVSGIEKSAAIFDDSRLLTLKGIPTIPQRSFIPTVRHYTNATFRGYVSPDGGTALYATLGVVGITPAVSPNLITSDTEVFNHVIYMDISAAGLTMYVRSSSPRFSRIKIIDNSDSTEFFNRTAVPDETAVKTSAGISYREYKYLDFTNNFNFDGRSYSVVLVAEDGSTLELPDPDFESNLKNLQITPLSDFAKRIVADGSITAAKLAPDSVTGDKILDKAITADKLADGVIPSGAGSSAEVVRTHVRIKGLRAPLAPGDISLASPPSGYNTCIIWNDNLPLDFGNSENIMANIVTNDDVTNTFTLPEGVWFISVDGHIRNNSGPFSSNNSRMDGNIQISNSSYTVKGDSVYFRASNAGNFYNKTATRIKDGVTETIACQSFAVRNVEGNLGASGIFASDGVTPFYIYARLIAQSTSGTVRFEDFNFDFRRMY